MDQIQLKTLLFLLWHDRLSRTSVLSVVVISLFLTLLLSFLSGVIVLGAYIGGFVAFSTIFSYRSEAPNFLSLITGKQKCLSPTSKSKLCHVCGDGKCNRHQPRPNSQQPWLDLDVPEEVDEAIEDFLNKILDEFVYVWYRPLSDDESFVLELRLSIRHAASSVLRRALQLDLAQVITNKLIPAGLSHLDDYLGSLRLSRKQQIALDRAALQYLGPRLHPAARNRENELEYLRKLTCLLLPQLLPSHQLTCRNYSTLIREILCGWVLLPLTDVLADPSIVNSLLLLLLERNTFPTLPNPSPTRVEFLSRFVSSAPVPRTSALRLDISSVLKDQELLYPFMQFLKGEGCVNILQFCLDVEEFNRKMLTPDLSVQDLDNLYREAWDLYSVYFNPKSPDSIPFNTAVVLEMHAILQEPAENIVKLRTTPPLFQAYEYAFSQLENVLGPLFHQSDDYFTLLCGQRLPTGYSKSGSSSPLLQGSPAKGPRASKKWSEGGAVARLSSRLHKIKGVLRTQPVEGHTYDVTDVTDPGLDLGETDYAEDLPLEEAAAYRDLSAWRVSIPSVETHQDINNKPVPVYNINVQRIDVRSEDDPESYHWAVERKYNDFYVLENKLTEFHGEFDIHLPPKRILFGPRGVEFMESKRLCFEDFLQRLLQKPNLRGSDLLFSFLRSPADFVPASGGIAAVPEGLGRMIRRSVPLRLRKERGQHLDSFLSTFVASTEVGKNKNTKYEWKDVSSDTPRKVRCLTKGIFGDNFGVPSNQLLFALAGTTAMNVPIQGIFDCILYLAVKVFGASLTFVRLALAIRTMSHNTVNALCRFFLDRKLKKLLVAPRLAHLVRLLQGVIFTPRTTSPTPEDLAARAARTQSLLKGLLPHWLARLAGSSYTGGIETLFSAVQNPALNKQLVYILLDTLAVELYPDVVTGDLCPTVEKKL